MTRGSLSKAPPLAPVPRHCPRPLGERNPDESLEIWRDYAASQINQGRKSLLRKSSSAASQFPAFRSSYCGAASAWSVLWAAIGRPWMLSMPPARGLRHRCRSETRTRGAMPAAVKPLKHRPRSLHRSASMRRRKPVNRSLISRADPLSHRVFLGELMRTADAPGRFHTLSGDPARR